MEKKINSTLEERVSALENKKETKFKSMFSNNLDQVNNKSLQTEVTLLRQRLKIAEETIKTIETKLSSMKGNNE